MSFKHTILILTLLTSGAMLTACGGGSTETGKATLSLDLVDAPVDGALRVVINVKGVSMHSPDGEDIVYQYCSDSAAQTSDETESEVLDPVEEDNESTMELADSVGCAEPEIREIDLLALTDGKAKRLLDDVPVEAGRYSWIRLDLDDTNPGYLVDADGEHPLTVPSGAKTGQKVVGGFSATINDPTHLVLDFDLRKSVHRAGDKYMLRPTLRLTRLENAAKQRLTGEWQADEVDACAKPMAYVFEGSGVTPDDLYSADTTGIRPLTTTAFTAHEDGTRSTFAVDYIAYGDYTVAYLCDGELDDPGTDDDVEFVNVTDVTVGG